MRILMLGTGPFAVPTFRGLLESSHDVPALITRPLPEVRGRPLDLSSVNPMMAFAQQRHVPLHDPERIGAPAALAVLEAYHPDLLVVCDYGQILPAAALATARLGGINLHGSLLPKYRGAAPINWALYHGESKTGVTVIHMTPQLDAGPCLVQRETEIGPSEDAVQLEARLAEQGWHAVGESIAMLEDWDGHSPLGTVQDARQATTARRLRKSDGQIDWNRTATELFNQVRAFKPWPGTFAYWDRPKGALRLLLTQVETRQETGFAGPPGTVIEAQGGQLDVACGQGVLRILELQPAGKKRQSAEQFLRGYPLQAGDRLKAEGG